MSGLEAGLWIRGIEAADEAAWRPLWEGYVRAVGADPARVATAATWRRLIDPAGEVFGWIGGRGDGPAQGFVHCLLHANTFSDRPVCYLEDLYAAPGSRGSGLAAALIATVREAGAAAGWRRVYWHTTETNYRARGLYDRFVARSPYIRYDIDLPG